MLYELEVLQSDCERIGDPVALPLTDIINNSGNTTNRLGKIWIGLFNSRFLFLEAPNTNQPTAAGRISFFLEKIENSFFSAAPPPATNVIRQGAKVLPTLDDRKKANGDNNNRFSAKSGNAIDKERIINIDTLNPYMNKWVSTIDFFLRLFCF